MNRRELARAKINLSLRVLAREAGGYHQIETLFCALELADEVDVEHADDVHLAIRTPPGGPVSAHGIPDGPENLAFQAASLFTKAARISGARVSLTKRIPHGAGLGGGSSDAAAVLRALNALHDNVLPFDRLLAIAAQLGSDVPFFVTRAPLAMAWGRGGRLLPLPPMPSAPVLLVMPPQRAATADVYQSLAQTRDADWVAAPGIVLPAQMTWRALTAASVNEFEDVTFARIPMLEPLLHALRDSGATLARMTGTGSVLFGVYEDAAMAERARADITARFTDTRTWLTRTLEHADTGVA